MCQLCDQPDLTPEEYDDHIRALVDQHRRDPVRRRLPLPRGVQLHRRPDGARAARARRDRCACGRRQPAAPALGRLPARHEPGASRRDPRVRALVDGGRRGRAAAGASTHSDPDLRRAGAGCSSPGPTGGASGRGSPDTGPGAPVSRCSVGGLPSSATSTGPTGSTSRRRCRELCTYVGSSRLARYHQRYHEFHGDDVCGLGRRSLRLCRGVMSATGRP